MACSHASDPTYPCTQSFPCSYTCLHATAPERPCQDSLLILGRNLHVDPKLRSRADLRGPTLRQTVGPAGVGKAQGSMGTESEPE